MLNEIKKCSISGISFAMEQEAYTRMDTYLKSLREAYKEDPDRDEIIADIEARIAELILSALSEPVQTVKLPLVENIIRQLGEVTEICGEEDDRNGSAEPIPTRTRIPRRLYRDIERGSIGGVCAGLSRYFNTDVAAVRLAAVSPCLGILWKSNIFGPLMAMFVIIYIVMWLVIPVARTARQKLEMDGENITARSIGNTTSAAAAGEERARVSVAGAVTVFGRILTIVMKMALAVVAVCVVAPLALFCILICVAAVVPFYDMSKHVFEFAGADVGNIDSLLMLLSNVNTGVLIFGSLAVIIPICLLLYIFVKLIVGRRMRWWVLAAGVVLWIAALFGVTHAGVKALNDTSDIICRSTVSRIDEMSDEEQEQYRQMLYDSEAPSVDN